MLYLKNKTPVNTEVLKHIRDPGGILTPNRWSRNPVRYTVAPRSQFHRGEAAKIVVSCDNWLNLPCSN